MFFTSSLVSLGPFINLSGVVLFSLLLRAASFRNELSTEKKDCKHSWKPQAKHTFCQMNNLLFFVVNFLAFKTFWAPASTLCSLPLNAGNTHCEPARMSLDLFFWEALNHSDVFSYVYTFKHTDHFCYVTPIHLKVQVTVPPPNVAAVSVCRDKADCRSTCTIPELQPCSVAAFPIDQWNWSYTGMNALLIPTLIHP